MIVLETYSHLCSGLNGAPDVSGEWGLSRASHWYLVGKPENWEQAVQAWIGSSVDRTGLETLTLETHECEDPTIFQPLVDWCYRNGVRLRFGVPLTDTGDGEEVPLDHGARVERVKSRMKTLSLQGEIAIPYGIVALSSRSIDRVFEIWFWLVENGLPYQFTLALTPETSRRDRYIIAEFLENLAGYPSLDPEWRCHYRKLRDTVLDPEAEPDVEFSILGSPQDAVECNQALSAGRLALPPSPMPGRERLKLIARKFKIDKWLLLFKGMFALARSRMLPARRYRSASVQDAREGALIVGWYGTETAGDKAILAGILAGVYAHNPGQKVIVASMLPFYTRKTLIELGYDGTVGVIPYDFSRLKDLIQKLELVVMGGGPLMDLVEMFDMLRVFELAYKNDTRVAIAGCGVGPARWPITRLLIKTMVERSERIVLRDQDSFDQLQSWGIRSESAEVGLDPAISYIAQSHSAQSGKSNRNPVLGLAIREWQRKFSHSMGQKAFEMRTLEMIGIYASICDDFIETYGGEVHLIPMHTLHIGGDDRWIQNRVKEQTQNKNQVIAHSGSYSPLEVAGMIQVCDIFVSMRYHSLLFATILGVPTIAIDYTLGGKIAAFVREQDVTDWIFDIRTISNRDMSDAIKDVWDRKSELRIKLREMKDDLVGKSNLTGIRIAEILSSHEELR